MVLTGYIRILFRQQVFLLGGHQIRTIDGEQRLSFTNELVTRVGVDLTNPAGETRLDIGHQALIDFNVSGGANIVGYILHLRLSQFHADALHTLRCKLHRSKW